MARCSMFGHTLDWEAIQRKVESGEYTYGKIAKDHRVTISRIKHRAATEGWKTKRSKPFEMPPEVAQAEKLSSEKSGKAKKKDSTASASTDTLVNQSSYSGNQSPKTYADFVGDFGEARMRRVFLRLPDPKTWRDLKTLDDIVRRARGLDGKNAPKAAGLFATASGVGAFVMEMGGQDDEASGEEIEAEEVADDDTDSDE